MVEPSVLTERRTEGYYETVLYGDNLIADDSLPVYFDKLRIVTRGKLADWGRLREVWRVNTGAYDHLIDRQRYRTPPRVYRLVSDAYEDPRNPSVQMALAEEQMRLGNTSKGMAALKTALGLKNDILLKRMQEPGFSRRAWAGYLTRHLAHTSRRQAALGQGRSPGRNEGGNRSGRVRHFRQLHVHLRHPQRGPRTGSCGGLDGGRSSSRRGDRTQRGCPGAAAERIHLPSSRYSTAPQRSTARSRGRFRQQHSPVDRSHSRGGTNLSIRNAAHVGVHYNLRAQRGAPLERLRYRHVFGENRLDVFYARSARRTLGARWN